MNKQQKFIIWPIILANTQKAFSKSSHQNHKIKNAQNMQKQFFDALFFVHIFHIQLILIFFSTRSLGFQYSCVYNIKLNKYMSNNEDKDSAVQLYNRIFFLPQSYEKIQSSRKLYDEIQEIIKQIMILKQQGRQQQIYKICFKNQKLVFVSKILKENYFQTFQVPQQVEDSPTLRDLGNQQIAKKQSRNFIDNPLSSINNLANSRTNISRIQQQLRNALISMFQKMIVDEKMLSFIKQMSVPLYVYIIMLKSFSLSGESECIRCKETDICLKFIYNYAKITKETIPKVFIYITKHFLESYHKDYEASFPQYLDTNEKDRIKISYSYIQQIPILILRKNLLLAAQCGILNLIYHKCIQGAFQIQKVESITQIIMNFCVEEKSRNIIFNTIDLGKTFAIFTNVDMAETNYQKLSFVNKQKQEARPIKTDIKNLDKVTSCAVMIEMYLSNWSILLYFLQEGRTLNNFIASLKRKSQEEINLLNENIFKKIMKRCINYDRKKIIKSNNIFNIQSNYLVLKSLLILNFFYKHKQFKELIYSNSSMLQLRQIYIEILLEYFIGNQQEYKNREINKILANNIRNINYYKKIDIETSMKRPQDQRMINNNIQSYYMQTLMPFQFTVQELKGFLIKVADIIESKKSKEKVHDLFYELNKQTQYRDQSKKLIQQNEAVDKNLLFQFYKIGLQISKQIQWLDKYLDISKYLSSILFHLRQTWKESDSIIDLVKRCRDYIKDIFETPQIKYFQYLNINILDDIGKFFYSDNQVLEQLNGHTSDITQAYKISRILLHIDYQRNRNQSIDGPQKIYSEISKTGSKALILQIIEIIKYSCQKNQNRFLNEHLQILFTLIYDKDQDIVYSIIELLEEFVNKSKQLEEHILKIDMKRIKNWNQRVLYLFLHYEKGIGHIQSSNNPNFLNDELQKWESGQNRKKIYSAFVFKELKKFTQDSILSKDYLNLNMDPSNHRQLVFLPWNIKIYGEYYPIFIEYKNLQDKLQLKIYIDIIIDKEIVIEELFIGSHNFTKYIETKQLFNKKKEDLKIKLTLEQIKKEQKSLKNQGNQDKRFSIQKEQAKFFIKCESDIYMIERININMPLTLDTYSPLSHPYNFINLLCRTQMGFQFLKKEKFIDHCLQIIKNDQSSLVNRQEYKGALVSIGTLCAASSFMQINEKIQIYELIIKKFFSKDHQIQEICLWIINVLIKDHIIRGKLKKQFILIETKRCGWICLPDISCNFKENYNLNYRERIEGNIKYIKDNLPEKMDNETYRYLYNLLNQAPKDDEMTGSRLRQIMEPPNIDGKVLQNIVKYVSVIDFPPAKIYQALNKLSKYIVNQKFDKDFPNGFLLP